MNPLKHVAFIMDGNGRWGLKNKNSRNQGHKEGLKTVENIINYSLKKDIKYLTFYAFSSENWKRPKKEINYLFKLLKIFLKNKVSEFIKNNIKLKILGEKKFSKELNYLLNKVEKKTKHNSKIQINLALNYGSKNEIINAIKKLSKKKKPINIKNLESFLYTKDIPEPDILIRTGNTKRLSNFLLWQISYSEIFFEKKLWPDFSAKDFNKVITKYKNTKRNYGSLT
jgi:undecaprenyl diphosphate synthase